MAEQIYNKVFYGHGSYYDDEHYIREKTLEDANEFFFKHDRFSVINIIENWNESRSRLTLVVYYKDYI